MKDSQLSKEFLHDGALYQFPARGMGETSSVATGARMSAIVLGDKRYWSWRAYQDRCNRNLGYVPPVSQPLQMQELAALGFSEAAKGLNRFIAKFFTAPSMFEHGGRQDVRQLA
jgi:hypothetical protein